MFESVTRPIWWLPTMGFFIFVAIELWMFAGPERIFEDPGVGRHMRTAELIVETGRIPRTDPLTFTEGGQRWIDFEWAFETTLGELYRAGGMPLIAAFCYALFGTTILGIYRTLLRADLSVGVVLLYTALAFCTLQLHFSSRPVLFTYLCMALVVEVWRGRVQPLTRDWLLLPPIFVMWANLHSGWAAALVFMTLSLAGRLIDRVSGRVSGEDAPLIPWFGLMVLCVLAVSLNPWGWFLFQHVFLLASTYKSFALWQEYLPPNFGQPSMSAIAVLFLLIVVFLARLTRRVPPWTWEILLPIFFFLFEGLKAQRHVLLLVIIAAVPIGRDMEALWQTTWLPWWRGWFSARFPILAEASALVGDRLGQFQARQRMAGGDAWLAMVAAVVFTALFVRTPISRDVDVGPNVTSKLVAFLKDHPDRFQRTLTTTWNAGPLLWKLRPDFRVSFDDRGDLFGDEKVFSYVGMIHGQPGWQATLEKGNYSAIVLEPELQLTQMLHFLPEWQLVYQDKSTVIYWKKTP